MLEIKPSTKNWNTRGEDTAARLKDGSAYAKGKIVAAEDTVKLLEAVLRQATKSISKAITRNRLISSQNSFAK